MQALLARLLAPFWRMLLQFGLKYIVDAIAKAIKEREVKRAKEAALAEAKKKYAAAGSNQELSPEQRAKEQEDAFRDYVNTINNLP